MRGRAGSGGDPDFGSDSFLDIVANLVGILIILVVLAGLRASQAPVESDVADIEPDPPVVEPEPVPLTPEPIPAPPADPEPEIIVVAKPEPKPPSGPTREAIRAQIGEAQNRVAALRSQLESLDTSSSQSELEQLRGQLAARTSRLRALRSELEKSAAQSGVLRTELAEVDRQYEQLHVRLAETNKRQEDLQRRRRPEEQLDLRINPIGRRSSGDEILFRVENGRVVHLPVKELIETAIRAERNSMASILSGRTQRGVAGPVDGVAFSYEYGIATVPAYSPSGQSMTTQVRMRGVVKTLAGAPAESIERALANGGLVERQLIQAEPGTVIRLAVSTDSFADARRIAAYARDLNFAVASRPIEPGSDLPVHLSDRSDAIAQ